MSRSRSKANIKRLLILIAFIIVLGISGYLPNTLSNSNTVSSINVIQTSISDIPEYQGNPYVIINNNIPTFSEKDYNTESFETYSDLDNLGRCGVAYAKIGKETMPTDDEERQSISEITPSGWKQAEYKGIIEGDYLYNRCHLIGYQLAGENANEKNLITGTRYLNIEGMLPFENRVAEYIEKNKNNHVLYRVTPIYDRENLVARGVQMEAYSIEDNGKGLCFNIFAYNVQPGISINYATGESKKMK